MYKIVGVGVDLCAVSRMESAVLKDHFIHRVFTEGERAYIAAQGKCAAQSAAACFAAKEAAAKALATGFSAGIMPAQIELLHEESGAPSLAFHGAAKERLCALGASRAHVSLSHEGDLAMAFVVLE